MNKLAAVGLALILFLIGTITEGKAVSQEYDRARNLVYPAIVNITVVSRYFSEGRAQRSPSGGSGVIVTKEGHVLTNYHVAGHTTRITCTLPNGEAMIAKVIAHDPLTDLSILQLIRNDNSKTPLPYAKLGDSDMLQVGDQVLAMGNPLMLSSSMTKGIVSNAHRVFTDFMNTEIEDMDLDYGEQTGIFTRWIQHDAAILPGNSGGPLVNMQGEVIGINELGSRGVGFAIPSNIARKVLKQVLMQGSVRRGYIGLNVLPVGKSGRTTGALVSAVLPDSPSEKAGIKPGDIVLSLNNVLTNTRFFEQVPLFYQRIADLPVGSTANFHLQRNGKLLNLKVSVSLLKPDAGDEEEFRKMGLTVQTITEMMALNRQLRSTKGVIVTGVRSGYPFEGAQPRISENDIITSVDGKLTPNMVAFKKTLSDLKKNEFEVSFLRKSEQIVTVVKIPKDNSDTYGGDLPKPWLGLKMQVVTSEIAQVLNIPGTTGFRITQVFPWSEVSKAGLQVGDIITAVNGSELTASRPQDSEDLRRMVEELSVGEKAEFSVLRNGKPLKVEAVLEASPTAIANAKTNKNLEFEFSVREITEIDKVQNRWAKDQQGLLTIEVTRGGWAQMSGLKADDLILSINGQSVTNVASFESVIKQVMKAQPKVIQIFARRDYRTHFIFIEPDWAKLGDGK